MATSVWTGTISFGLVSIPVKMFTATASHDVSFNLLHNECRGRINLQNYCPQCERVVERSELIKGYQYEKNQYAIVTEEDIKSVKPESSSILDILKFVEINEIDPIYFERTYYVGADKGSEKAFALLARAMEDMGKAAVGRLVMRNHEYLVLIRPGMDGLLVHTMLYSDEIRENEFRVSKDTELRAKELDLAKQLIESLSEPLNIEEFKNEYISKMEEMLEAKIHGRKLTVVTPTQRPKVTDLMDALQKSVQMARDNKPMARVEDRKKLRKAR
ncbi:Ku protein [bacterium]|nr:Ku protein [bacterium]MCI0605368.1 Ku protein [bacterium]